MPKYVKGDFSHFANAERMVAMQTYVTKLEQLYFSDTVPFDQRHKVNSEIEDLLVKLTRGKSAVGFDPEKFFELLRKRNSNLEYKQEMDDKIAGAWVDPAKKAQEEENAQKKADKEKEE